MAGRDGRLGGLTARERLGAHGRLLVIVVASIAVTGCKDDRYGNLDAARQFFSKTTIGSSPDYGVMKFGDDHVITVHGFANDRTACEGVAAALNQEACAETQGQDCLNPFSCAALNQ